MSVISIYIPLGTALMSKVCDELLLCTSSLPSNDRKETKLYGLANEILCSAGLGNTSLKTSHDL